MKKFRSILLVSTLVLAVLAGEAFGYLLPRTCEPRPGAQISTSPQSVLIHFDGKLDPAFSTIRVFNGKGEQIDNRDAQVNGSEDTSLQVTLLPLPAGTYRVQWTAKSLDGQITRGDYAFTLK